MVVLLEQNGFDEGGAKRLLQMNRAHRDRLFSQRRFSSVPDV
jgi:hypothetical protein